MIIVKFEGGLGNQMFQYALYNTLEKTNKTVKADITWYEKQNVHNGFELEKVFPNIKLKKASLNEINELADNKLDIVNKIRRKVVGRRSTYYKEHTNEFIEDILQVENKYLDGFWQTDKYFADSRYKLVDKFKFNIKLNEKEEKLLTILKQNNAVSLHVRRGDYVTNSNYAEKHHVIKNNNYYIRALKYMENNLSNIKYFIFSDDPEWVRKTLDIKGAIIIDWNKGSDSYKDMFWMSQCKHNIIANSTFSWWGAWLNQNPDKIVIAPNKWFNTMEAPDIWCEDWIRIEVQ
ncbi:MAG: alpha-1,2-fucosyltransferase [Zhenhengia sp.]|uniref:alpha-1,2-fucosyltransferase n=1 Tax=Zhenhengia sp. TaxID=2944208 RepID=UPI003996B065